jgi:hypothetical protein
MATPLSGRQRSLPGFDFGEGRADAARQSAASQAGVPSRKTDMQDAEWIAQLLQCGLEQQANHLIRECDPWL